MNGISRSLFFLKWKERGGGVGREVRKAAKPRSYSSKSLACSFCFFSVHHPHLSTTNNNNNKLTLFSFSADKAGCAG